MKCNPHFDSWESFTSVVNLKQKLICKKNKMQGLMKQARLQGS